MDSEQNHDVFRQTRPLLGLEETESGIGSSLRVKMGRWTFFKLKSFLYDAIAGSDYFSVFLPVYNALHPTEPFDQGHTQNEYKYLYYLSLNPKQRLQVINTWILFDLIDVRPLCGRNDRPIDVWADVWNETAANLPYEDTPPTFPGWHDLVKQYRDVLPDAKDSYAVAKGIPIVRPNCTISLN